MLLTDRERYEIKTPVRKLGDNGGFPFLHFVVKINVNLSPQTLCIHTQNKCTKSHGYWSSKGTEIGNNSICFNVETGSEF